MQRLSFVLGLVVFTLSGVLAAQFFKTSIPSGSTGFASKVAPLLIPQQFEILKKEMGDQLAYPPEDLVKNLLNRYPGTEIIATLIPHGRSPEAKFTDEAHPRVVFALMPKEGAKESSAPPLFFAHSSKLKLLQMIMWNNELGEMEFFSDTNYIAGKAFAPTKNGHVSCTGCHQHRGPIFSVEPWSESMLPEDLEEIIRSRRLALDPFAKFLIKAAQDTEGPLRIDAEAFDSDAIFKADVTILKQKFCQDLCGSDVECRRYLLKRALIPVPRPQVVTDAWVETGGDPQGCKNIVRAKMPRAGIGFPTSAFPDRRPTDVVRGKLNVAQPRLPTDGPGPESESARRSYVSFEDSCKFIYEFPCLPQEFIESIPKNWKEADIQSWIQSPRVTEALSQRWPFPPSVWNSLFSSKP